MNSNNLINNISYLKTDNAFNDIENIIETSQKIAYQTVDLVLLRRNWLIGKRIFEEKISSNSDNYGKNFISKLSISLTQTYGKGFTKTNLYSYLSFYKNYKKIFHSVSGKSRLLSWTHYRMLLQVNDKKAREWYENEAIREFWSVRTLQRNISTQYYYRILKTNLPNSTKAKTKQKDLFYQDKLEFIKNPVIAEFLEASSVFYDDEAIIFDDPIHSITEERFNIIGLSNKLNLLIVNHCYRRNDDLIRIISARKATKKETNDYLELQKGIV